MERPLLGAHVSTAGGVALAFERGAALGCDALQIFVKSPSQWRSKALAPEEAEEFRAAHVGHGRPPVVAHAAYLINLAAADPALLEKSRAGLADELGRAAALGLDGVVVHPGAHLGRGVDAALTAVAASLDAVCIQTAGAAPKILLELTAGQGTVVGHTLEQLAAIRARAEQPERLGYCLDTCHAFAAGYDVGSEGGVERFLADIERILGFGLVRAVHLNDSVGELGSRKDRHANIGAGRIALAGFQRLLMDSRTAAMPMILETPVGDDEEGHARDLATLRGLLR